MNRLVLELIVLSTLATVVVCGCASSRVDPSVTIDNGAPGLGEERIPEGEAEAIKQLVAQQVKMMKVFNPAKRGMHPDHHGCVEADFVIRRDVPKQYQVGIFKEAKTFKALVRFSNGGSKADTERNVHGMAIKVFGVKGPRAIEKDGRDDQDFVLIDSQNFFARDVKAQLSLLRAVAEGEEGMAKFAKQDPDTAKRFADALKEAPASPFSIAYFSTVPFKLADKAVKYAAKPSNFLREAMVDRLTEGKNPVVFDLSIIPQMHSLNEPIEDPTKPWKATPIRVATIEIKPQKFDTPGRMKECEEASFNPWNALDEHRPLGGINRARREVYAASVELRSKARPK